MFWTAAAEARRHSSEVFVDTSGICNGLFFFVKLGDCSH